MVKGADGVESVRAWLLLSAGEDREFGSNDGYDDRVEAHYSWDSTVPHHRDLRVGDAIALWDKRCLLGTSVIETIDRDQRTKTVHRCPVCGRAHIKARKTRSPIYKCFTCQATFDEPTHIEQVVHTYRANYEAGWRPAAAPLNGAILRRLCHSPKSQQSMRALDWAGLELALTRIAGTDEAVAIARRLPPRHPGGHVLRSTRVRLGQASFRARLLAKHGPVCAFSGPVPKEALEAAHLYSYAARGTHEDGGGLLLRRDLHRLFDLGQILIDPDTLTIRLRGEAARCAQYQNLDGQSLHVSLAPTALAWVRLHWQQHHAPTRRIRTEP